MHFITLMRSTVASATMLVVLALSAGQARGFAEEPIAFRDPASGAVWDGEQSTIHTEMTYILALAAGFSAQNAATIAIWNQLVDSEKLGPGSTVTYTNCLGSFGAAPNPVDVCPDGYGAGQQVWPMTFDNTCATSRFGPYSPFFHYPHDTDAEIGALREWAWGRTQTLMGYAAYAWGNSTDTVINAACRYMRPETINTGIAPGSLQAFGTYLHSLADGYSHRDCLAVLAAMPLPNLWGTHTIIFSEDTKSCYYVPNNPKNDDAHGQEFDSGLGTSRTDAAVAATFAELVRRSTQMEGEYHPLAMNTVLAGMAGTPTLEQALFQFVHTWEFEKAVGLPSNPGEYAANRRALSDVIAAQILSQRLPKPRSIDIDLSAPATTYDALTDGLLIVRYLYDMTGMALTNGVLGGTATRTEPFAIKTRLDTIRSSLDVDANGTVDVLTDGLLILRYLFGVRGAALVAGIALPSGTTDGAIEVSIQSIMP